MASKSKTAAVAPSLIVDARWFARHRRDRSVVLIDTRLAEEYWVGHLRSARHFDPFPFHHSDTSERGVAEFRAQLEWIFSALGITGRETVVFYENESGMRAARGAWALEYMGHPRARMLDGGLKALGRERLVTKAVAFAPSRFKGRPRDETLASCTYLVERIGRPETQIFDVRSDAEYYGERVRAKHGGAIPGAYHQDWPATLTEAGTFKSRDALQQQFRALGLSAEAEVIPYCQGGYRAAHSYVALRLAGFPRVRNYYGSWGEWGNRDDLPIDHPVRPRT